jgi:hypothetical protein
MVTNFLSHSPGCSAQNGSASKNVVERKTRDVINPEANEDMHKLCALSVN